MFTNILVPVDIAEPELAKPAIMAAIAMARSVGGKVRLVNVLPMTPVMLAEYVPPDFDVQQRKSAEETLAAMARDSGLAGGSISTVIRQGGIYHEVIQEAKEMGADLIVMTSHRPDMRSYFLGSNAGHVVRYANCSVLVVRP
ncbi:MAG: Universal stress protein F [Pseudorhodoplanes sp.]|nr:Universal stress protein F [Pseudorhodoplanes sp.]GIK79231.1 MAG: universal stress protein UspA [Alphaproteobacteria bacterium]